jgi:hypothetical protein
VTIPLPWTRAAVCAVLAAGTAGLALALTGANSPLRAPLTLLFLAAAPAVAVTGLLRGFDRLAMLVIGAAGTIAVNALVAVTMLGLGVWSPRAGLLAVAVITVIALAGQLPPVRAKVAGRRAERQVAQVTASTMRADDAVTTQMGAIAPAGPAVTGRTRASRARRPTAQADVATAQFAAIRSAGPGAPTGAPTGTPTPPVPASDPDDQAAAGDAPTAQFAAIGPDGPDAPTDVPGPLAREAGDTDKPAEDPTAQIPGIGHIE